MLSGGCSWFAVTDGSAFGDSIIRKAFRRTDPPQEIGVAASNSRTPRTKARRLVCNGGYSRFAVNDGLRFANPSYELFRLTALRCWTMDIAVSWQTTEAPSAIPSYGKRSVIPRCIDSPPPNSKTPRTKARRLVCNGGYSRFAVNDGLRFANPSYELIRLTALIRRTAVVWMLAAGDCTSTNFWLEIIVHIGIARPRTGYSGVSISSASPLNAPTVDLRITFERTSHS